MLTPRELTSDLTPGASSVGGASVMGGSGGAEGVYEREHNPFGEFSSVTRDFGDHP